MKTEILKKAFVTTLLCVVFVTAFGQQQTDSLYQYLEIAARNNPAVLQKFNEYQAALQKIPQAGSLSDPELNVGVFLSPMELISGNQVADIRLMQMFPWFGVLKNAKDEMSLMARAKFESFRNEKLQVFYEVQSGWYDLHKIGQTIRISQDNLEILRTLERLALIRYKTVSNGTGTSSQSSGNSASPPPGGSGSSGMNSMGGNTGTNSVSQQPASMQSSSMGSSSGVMGLSDLYRIQIEIANLENNIALLNNQMNTAKARFNAYLNRSATSNVQFPETLNPDSLNIALLAVSDSMLAKNPMLSMLSYEQQSLDARKKMVTRMGYPMIGLGVNYSLINRNEMSTSAMNGKDMIMPMVTITLPIYRKKYKAMQTETDLMKAATGQNYQATANSLQTEYYEALQAYHDAERRMKLYENQSMLAKKSLDIMVKSFSASASGAGLTDILSIRQQTLDYELKQIEALIDFNTSIARLKRLMANIEIQ